MSETPAADCRIAARLLGRLPELVEEATHDRDLTPAEVAEQAGIRTATLMGIVAGDYPPSHSASIALLLWLGGQQS